jgi:hypothetical protein
VLLWYDSDSTRTTTSSTQPKPIDRAMPVLRLHAVIRGALNNKNRISEIGDPCGIPVGVGKLSERS